MCANQVDAFPSSMDTFEPYYSNKSILRMIRKYYRTIQVLKESEELTQEFSKKNNSKILEKR